MPTILLIFTYDFYTFTQCLLYFRSKQEPMKKLIILLLAFLPMISAAQNPYLITEPYITSGLVKPVEITNCKDSRLFIVEQDGRIRIVLNDVLRSTPFLDINAQVLSTGTEQGLLGLAFHPDYKTNGYFFVNYINNSGNTVISRFSVNPADSNLALPSSEVILKTITQPYTNHNGGDIEFGPDGYLYIPLGDGGSANDPQNRAQNKKSYLGKIMRWDVSHGDTYLIPPDNPFVNDTLYYPEIWSLGWRNPWKINFDRANGDLWIGDVGQDVWEEVDVEEASNSGGGNYGWRCYEASVAFNTSGCQSASSYITPVYEYQHASGNCSVTGGEVYRGGQYGNLFGHYVFTDFCVPSLRTLQKQGASYNYLAHSTWSGAGMSAFGSGVNGSMYVANLYNGQIRKLVDTTSCAPAAWLSDEDTLRICDATGVLRTPPGDSLTYAWYRNGNILSGSTENELAVSQNGDYVVVVTNLGTGCTASDSVVLRLTLNPPAVSLSGIDSVYCVFDSPVALNGTPAGGVYSGIGVSGSTFDPSVAGIGTYLVQYKYTATNGCVYKSILKTEVRSCVNLVEQEGLQSISMYPNPTGGNVTFSCKVATAGDYVMTVTDLHGRTAWTEVVNLSAGTYSRSLDFTGLANGTYLLQMSTGNAQPSVLLFNKVSQ